MSTLSKVGQTLLVMDFACSVSSHKILLPTELRIKEILIIYAQNHHMIRSIQTLKTHCCKFHLFRQKDQTDLDEAIAFV